MRTLCTLSPLLAVSNAVTVLHIVVLTFSNLENPPRTPRNPLRLPSGNVNRLLEAVPMQQTPTDLLGSCCKHTKVFAQRRIICVAAAVEGCHNDVTRNYLCRDAQVFGEQLLGICFH